MPLFFHYCADPAEKTACLLRDAAEFQHVPIRIMCPEGTPLLTREDIVACIDAFGEEYDFMSLRDEAAKCILFVDDAHTLKEEHAQQLMILADHGMYVNCYGLRTDTDGRPYRASMFMLTHADDIIHVPVPCTKCEQADATMTHSDDSDGYLPMCRRCFFTA